MRALWQMWSDLLDDETCDSIVADALKIAPRDAAVGTQRLCDASIRDSLLRWVHPDNQDFREFYKFVDHYFEWANANAFNVDARFVRNMQFTQYQASRGSHYKWHQDTFLEGGMPEAAGDRKLSMIVQLSDPTSYEGGTLQLDVPFPPDPAELRKRGTLIVFPSILFHRVLPVTSGERFSLVVWKEGPAWR